MQADLTLLSGLLVVVAAPAVIRTFGLLMPVRQRILLPTMGLLYWNGVSWVEARLGPPDNITDLIQCYRFDLPSDVFLA